MNNYKDNRKIRDMLDKDFHNFKEGRAYFRDHVDDSHRFIDDVNGEITGNFDDMPDFAKDAIRAHRSKPGDTNISTNHQLLTDNEIEDIKARRAKFNAKKSKKCSKGTRLR